MSINADVELANLPPWSVTLGGREYVARPVSWPAFRRFEQAMAEATAKESRDLLESAYRGILSAAFPPKAIDALLFRPSVVTRILNLTPVVKKRVLEDFFGHLASSQGQTTPAETPSSVSGPSSTSEPNGS